MKSSVCSNLTFTPSSLGVELVAYRRKGGSYDMYLFEPPGSVPELESHRVDAEHIFVASLPDEASVQEAENQLCKRLAAAYEVVPFLEERGSRIGLGLVYDALRRADVQSLYVVRVGATENWVLRGRRKDLPAAMVAAKAHPTRHFS